MKALETDPETLAATQLAPRLPDEESGRELVEHIREWGARFTRATYTGTANA